MTTNLGDTATITILTAVPGSGKSLRLCQLIHEASARGELVFQINIPELKLPHIKIDDPRKWQELPEGSLLVVDEAQDFFPARRSGDPPSYIREMSRMRHFGIRMVLSTQNPDFLDTYIRGLGGTHEHLVRQDGKQAATVYRRTGGMLPNVSNEKTLKRTADYETWAYPTQFYGAYKSAPVHTFKRHTKARVKRGLIGLGIAVSFVAAVVWFLGRDVKGETEPGSGGRASVALLPQAPAAPGEGRPLYQDSKSYLTAHKPLVAAIPSSAPIFHDRPVVAEPRVFCMSSLHGEDGRGRVKGESCTCMTEQGTLYTDLLLAQCFLFARNGTPYDPYLKPSGDMLSQRRIDQSALPLHSDVRPAVPGVLISSAGGIGNGVVTDSDVQTIGGVN